MSNIKTAISIDKDLYKQVKKLSDKYKIPRSRIFSQAVDYFINKNANIELLKRINEAYSDEYKEMDSDYLKTIKTNYSKLIDKW